MSLVPWLSGAALAMAALEAWRHKVGDALVRPGFDRVADQQIFFYGDSHAVLEFTFPLRNVGKQQALLIDARAFLQPAGERYSDLQPVCRLINLSSPRYDGYWEAWIIPIKGEMMVKVKLNLAAPDLRSRLAELETMRFELHYKYYCRTPLNYRREELILKLADFREVKSPPGEPTPEVKLKPPVPKDAPVVPLKTHLLRPGEDVVEVTARYLADQGRPGDIIAWAESAVAVMQGRVAYCEDIQPRWLARKLNCLFGMHSSMSSCYAMEMAMREVGMPRILLATLAGVAGKLTRKDGEFYRLAGRAVAAIDDCTGTLPPFDKHVVMGPARGEELVRAIKARTGLEACIVDANDLGKVDVFHISNPSRTPEVVKALGPNPQGNAGEMTPLVLIRSQTQA